MIEHPFDAIDEHLLRRRQSAKWTLYAPDVLPVWVAEMDVPLAEPIKIALKDAIDLGDTGYASAVGLDAAFASWARAEWGWDVSASDVHLVSDVVTAIAEILRVATERGDPVVIEPPVYPPFAATITALGRRVVNVPLIRNEAGWAPDVDAIERAYEGGARAHLLCSPQNPTGVVYSRATLGRIGDLAARYGVLVLADEIHAPLTLPGSTHTPMPMVSEAARQQSVVVTSASKAWNVAGLKAAVMVACAEWPRALLAKLSPAIPYHAGHLGVIASRAAFERGNEWRSRVIAFIDRNRRFVADLLRAELPAIGYVVPEASYLAWLDCRSLGLGADPARVFLERGRVALSSGPTFGAEGAGFARLNIATSKALLEEAVRRIKRAI